MILVATPYRACTNPALVDHARVLFSRLTYADKGHALYKNEYGYSPDYHTNAAARNELIAKYLHNDISDVLWCDVDLIYYPPDLIETLLAFRDRVGCQIAAPRVMLHRQDANIDVWYDVGGFQQNGQWVKSDVAPAPFDFDSDLDSVGTCYLIPTEVFRQGAKYGVHVSDFHHTYDPEHITVMQAARKMGMHIRCDPSTTVWHAWLPGYGMHWQY